MEFLNKIKSTLTITAVVYVVLGLVMLLIPEAVSDFICYIIGALFLVLGAAGIVSYIKARGTGFAGFTLVVSIIFAALGVYILCNPVSFASFIPLVVGIMLVVDSFSKFQSAFDLKRLQYKNWWQMLLVGIAILLLGALMIFNPFESIALFIRVIGILLIFDGFSNLFTIYSYSKVK